MEYAGERGSVGVNATYRQKRYKYMHMYLWTALGIMVFVQGRQKKLKV